jgi:cell division protease FtsH
MSEAIGPIAVLPADGDARFFPGVPETSETTQRLVDEEVRRIVEEAHAVVTGLLRENRDKLEGLARALLAAETLDSPDAYAAAGLPPLEAQPAPTAA